MLSSPGNQVSLQSNEFFRLPVELIQDVAYLLPTNTDRCNFASCSSDLAAIILPHESRIWRNLFRDTYSESKKRTSLDCKVEYQIRAIVLSRPPDLAHGQGQKQTYWLELLRDMILEGLFQRDDTKPIRNFECIRKALVKAEFLNRPVSGYRLEKPDPLSGLFCAVQLALTYLALDPLMSVRCLQSDYDIQTVYGYPSTRALFDENGVPSLETALNIRNFWLRHLLNPYENTFRNSYMNLPLEHQPKAPSSLRDTSEPGRKLSLFWSGYESCICPYLSVEDTRQTCADLLTHLVEVEHITLQLEERPKSTEWPDIFVQRIVRPNNQARYFRGTQTYHGSAGARSAPIRGFIESISTSDFRGLWSRICWVSYESSSGQDGGVGLGQFFNEPWPPHNLQDDFRWIYRYEGVVVPGSELVVGQWSDVLSGNNVREKGPFIFWSI